VTYDAQKHLGATFLGSSAEFPFDGCKDTKIQQENEQLKARWRNFRKRTPGGKGSRNMTAARDALTKRTRGLRLRSRPENEELQKESFESKTSWS